MFTDTFERVLRGFVVFGVVCMSNDWNDFSQLFSLPEEVKEGPDIGKLPK